MQRRLAKTNDNTATEPGGRMFLDITSLNFTTSGGNRHIGLLVDEFSRLKFDIYLKSKSDLQEHVLDLLKVIFIHFKIRVKRLRMDNTGENIHIEKIQQSRL